MNRTVTADLAVEVSTPARLAFQVAVADPVAYGAEETITLTVDGADVPFTTVAAPSGGRVWVVQAPVGSLELSYRATLSAVPAPPPVDLADEFVYHRPSRYCESDRMIGLANRLFRGIDDHQELLAAVSSWVGTQLEYVSGSSGQTDGAVDTLLAGRGVCRDYAHLAVALLRALGISARLTAVYAPGLQPMDFHAVAEALVAGAWYVVDGTLLAPRESLVRIATGRDAADTSFLSHYAGEIDMTRLEVTATVGGDLPADDVLALVALR